MIDGKERWKSKLWTVKNVKMFLEEMEEKRGWQKEGLFSLIEALNDLFEENELEEFEGLYQAVIGNAHVSKCRLSPARKTQTTGWGIKDGEIKTVWWEEGRLRELREWPEEGMFVSVRALRKFTVGLANFLEKLYNESKEKLVMMEETRQLGQMINDEIKDGRNFRTMYSEEVEDGSKFAIWIEYPGREPEMVVDEVPYDEVDSKLEELLSKNASTLVELDEITMQVRKIRREAPGRR